MEVCTWLFFCLNNLNSRILFFQKASGYKLKVLLNEYNKPSVLLWSLFDSQSSSFNEWKLGQIFYKTNDSYRLFIEESAGTDNKNYVGERIFLFKVIIIKKIS